MGFIGKIEDILVAATLFISSIMIMVASIYEMNDLVKAKQTDSDIYRTHIACISLTTAGLAGSIIAFLTRFASMFVIYILIVILILLGVMAIGTMSKAIDDKRKKGETETDAFKLDATALFCAIAAVCVGAGVIAMKVMYPSG
jgi:hypothetical protein